MKLIAGLCAAVAMVTVPAPVRSQPSMQEVTAVGCVRAWKPTTDVTSHPGNNKQLGVYLLTPIASSSSVTALPTYWLTPTMVVNFAAHLDDKVEVTGVSQPAPQRRTIGAIVGAPTPRPEEDPDVQSMPRLTVKTLKKISDACPS